MRLSQVKLIHTTVKQWWDAMQGNTYFSARIMVIGVLETEIIYVPFQYAPDDHYKEVLLEAVHARFPRAKPARTLWNFCESRTICLRARVSRVSKKLCKNYGISPNA